MPGLFSFLMCATLMSGVQYRAYNGQTTSLNCHGLLKHFSPVGSSRALFFQGQYIAGQAPASVFCFDCEGVEVVFHKQGKPKMGIHNQVIDMTRFYTAKLLHKDIPTVNYEYLNTRELFNHKHLTQLLYFSEYNHANTVGAD